MRSTARSPARSGGGERASSHADPDLEATLRTSRCVTSKLCYFV
jgi:hypothetical protein